MALCVLVLAVMALHQSMRAPSIGAESFGSGTAPMAVAVALIVLTIIMVFQDRAVNRSAVEKNIVVKSSIQTLPPLAKGGLLAATLTTYVALLEATKIPFWVASFIFLAAAARIIEGRFKTWLRLSLVTAVSLAIAIELVFTQLLHIDLP